MTVKLKKGDCCVSEGFGPLYIVDTFRDSSGRCYVGINGADGVNYSVHETEIIRKITRDQFNQMVKAKQEQRNRVTEASA